VHPTSRVEFSSIPAQSCPSRRERGIPDGWLARQSDWLPDGATRVWPLSGIRLIAVAQVHGWNGSNGSFSPAPGRRVRRRLSAFTCRWTASAGRQVLAERSHSKRSLRVSPLRPKPPPAVRVSGGRNTCSMSSAVRCFLWNQPRMSWLNCDNKARHAPTLASGFASRMPRTSCARFSRQALNSPG